MARPAAARSPAAQASPHPGLRGHGRPAGVELEAAPAAADAAGAGPVDGNVAEFAGQAVAALHQRARADDPAAHPGAQRDQHEDLGLLPGAAGELGVGGRVAVVLHDHGAVQPGLRQPGQRGGGDAQVDGAADVLPVPAEPARDGQPHRPELAAAPRGSVPGDRLPASHPAGSRLTGHPGGGGLTGHQLADDLPDQLHRLIRPLDPVFLPELTADRAGFVQQDTGDLAAAQVYAGHGHASDLPHDSC
jgi:hypothetical protein